MQGSEKLISILVNSTENPWFEPKLRGNLSTKKIDYTDYDKNVGSCKIGCEQIQIDNLK